MESVLQIPLKNLVEGRLEIKGLYEHCKMLFNEFLVHYESKVLFKKLVPIEKLSREDKLKLWEEAGKITEGENRIRICKVIYVIDYLIIRDYENKEDYSTSETTSKGSGSVQQMDSF